MQKAYHTDFEKIGFETVEAFDDISESDGERYPGCFGREDRPVG